MAKTIGRPRKSAVPTSLQVPVPFEIMKQALLRVAESPVEEVTVERFIVVAAPELKAASANERTKAEVKRKLLQHLASSGWEEQEVGVDAVLDAFEAWLQKEANPADTSQSTGIPERTVRRTAKAEKNDAPATVGQVASVPRPQPGVDDDGYESFGNADHEALREAKAAGAEPIPMATNASGTANAAVAAPKPEHRTQDQRSGSDARLAGMNAASTANTSPASAVSTCQVATEPAGRRYTTGGLPTSAGDLTTTTTVAAGGPNPADNAPPARQPEQAKFAVTGIAPMMSGTLSVTPNNGPPHVGMSPLGEDERDRQPVMRGTTPTVPARSTPGLLDRRPGERDPDPNRAGLPVARPTQTPTLPGGQDPRPAGDRDVQDNDGGSRSRP